MVIHSLISWDLSYISSTQWDIIRHESSAKIAAAWHKSSHYFNVKYEASKDVVMGCKKTYGEGQSAAPDIVHLAEYYPQFGKVRKSMSTWYHYMYSQFKISYSTRKEVT